jgi:hypothetical protein
VRDNGPGIAPEDQEKIFNLFNKIIGNFFLGANKPIRPTRLFTDVPEGLRWLKERS